MCLIIYTDLEYTLTLSMPHVTIISFSHLGPKSALAGTFQCPKFSVSLV